MPEPSPTELQRRIVECATRARSVDVRPFELDASGEVESGLVAPVVAALEGAIALCLDALETYDPDDGPPSEGAGPDGEGPPSGVLHVAGDAQLRRRDRERQVADVAFLGVTELRSKLHRLQSLPPHVDPWEAVAECGSALRRIAKSLTALERALCRLAGLEPKLGHRTQLGASLEVRRQYQRLRKACDGAPSDATLERAIRRAGTAIAVLIGKRIYPDLRVNDRRQLRELQARILSWLKLETGDPIRIREGKRLWQDLAGFTRLLENVSRRQELVEHDAKVLARAREAIEQGAVHFDRELFEQLETLVGLDAEVDRLLAGHVRETAAWRAVVARLRRERPALALERPSSSPASPWEPTDAEGQSAHR